MEPPELEVEPSDGPNYVVVAASVGLVVLVLALVFRRWRRRVGRGLADLTGEGVVMLTEAIVDELRAS